MPREASVGEKDYGKVRSQRFGGRKRGDGSWRPAPFQRPRIDLDRNGHVVRREWRDVDPQQVNDGDIVAGVGKVQQVKSRSLKVDFAESVGGDYDVSVWVVGADEESWRLHYQRNGEKVKAFTW